MDAQKNNEKTNKLIERLTGILKLCMQVWGKK